MIIGKAITAGGSGGVSIDEILPSGFEQIKYIEATGTQYIDTGYAFTDNFSWEITFDDIAVKDTTIFGGRTSAERTALLYYGNATNNNGVAYICCPIAGMNGRDTPFKLLTADPSKKHTVKMAVVNNTASVWLDGEKKYDNTAFEGSYISGVSQVVFADNYGADGIKEQTSAKVYGLKMWQGESLVRNFVPCRNDLGEVGLYDLVNARFYGNNGSGNFVAGKRTVTLKGSGIGCVLTVETAEGALVEATLESKKVLATAGADGTAILLLEKEGLWTISSTLGGETKSTEVLVEHNIEEELVFADPVLENNTWEFISEVARKGKASQYWNIGDTKQITFNNVVYEVQIIGFDHDTVENPTTYGREKAGITFQFKDLPKNRMYMANPSNTEDNVSWIDTTLRNTMYSYRTLFETSLQNVMVRIVHDYDKSYASGNITQCSDLLFVLSETEYLGTKSQAANILGTQYEFYAAGNSRIKYEVGTTTAERHWTRSKTPKTANDYWVSVDTDGSFCVHYSGSTNGGPPAYAFCV